MRWKRALTLPPRLSPLFSGASLIFEAYEA